MALTSYSELQASVADWLARSDLSALQIADCITLFESTANRRLRVRQMVTFVEITLSEGNAILPTDYLAWRDVYQASSPYLNLEHISIELMNIYFPTYPAGVPLYFAITGQSIVIVPTSADSIGFDYYAKIPALSDTDTTNWLLDEHPDAYLFGTLTEANAFVQDEKALIWKARRDEIFNEIDKLGEKTKGPSAIHSVGPIV